MADIKIELNPEDINKSVADMIAKSVLGSTIAKMVDQTITDISRSYDNPVKKLIEQLVKVEIEKILTKESHTRIVDLTRKHLTDEVIEATISVIVAKITKLSSY